MLEIKNIKFSFPEDKLKSSKFTSFKKSLIGKLLGQRLDVFNAEASVDGPWEPIRNIDQKLSKIKSYKENKESKSSQKMRDKNKLLQDHGVLRASFTGVGPSEGTAQLEEVSEGDDIGIRTHVEYAAIHNYGGTINHPGTDNGFGKGIEIPPYDIEIPARPFDEFTDDNLEEINELTEQYFYE